MGTSVHEAGFSMTIQLNPSHIIYTGHFPGHPVTPGVIQMQIVHELLERQFCQDIKLLSMSRCKFLNILNPQETSRVEVHIEFSRIDSLVTGKARGENENGSVVFFNLNAVYQFI